VFFSFHYGNDVWRANQVRNSNVVHGADVAGFFDHSEYLEAKKKSDEGIRRMILRHLKNTTVTVVLIGKETAERPWVRYEIAKSVEQGNGLVGVRIHHLKDQKGDSAWFAGDTPAVPRGVEFPVYDWDKDTKRFAAEIEAAGRRSDRFRGV
jgi:hypothetical protein